MLRVKHASRTDSRRILQPLLEPRPIEFAAGVIQIRPLSFPQTIEIKIRRLGQRVTARALRFQDVVTRDRRRRDEPPCQHAGNRGDDRSEEHTSELQSLKRISNAVFCLKKKKYYTLHKI